MTSAELNKLLIQSFPNLKTLYDELVSWQEEDDTGSHSVYGDILAPYLIKSLENNDEVSVKNILIFIEKILELNDTYSEEVITFSVLQGIEYKYRDQIVLKKNLGKLTIKNIDEIRNSNY